MTRKEPPYAAGVALEKTKKKKKKKKKMTRGSVQIFFKTKQNKRPTSTWKGLNITSHQGNENQMQITMRFHLIPVRMAVIKKARREKHWGRCRKKGIPVTSFFKKINWFSHYRKPYGGSSKN